ncbi:cache domain-containing protein [Sediminicoccus rosea]|jgi:PAS domain-containing protein|uniref:Cache domain-containing protein n=1 Tax=Sediminicoccus rosea TaxID=1225128 RepID=A0ABZ0PBD2_9PROT|nr:cache domain-containing protein [Sediminicoccus rosea]WPB83010.1 cache domain-containing protein [Sediminicoccus rosea]
MMASTRRAALLAGWLAALATGAGAQTAGLAPLAPALRDPAGIASRLAILLDRQWDHLQWVARSVQEFWPPQDAEELRFILDTAHDNAPHIIWIGVATVADGRVLAATRKLLEGDDVSQRPWFIEGTRREAAVDVHDAVLLQRALNRDPSQGMLRLIDFTSPIRDREGRIVAMIGSHILWEWVVGVIRREEGHAGAPIALISAQGEVLLVPEGVPAERLRQAQRFPVRQRADAPSFGWQLAVLTGA